MKCFELKDDTLKEGLLISDDAGPPRICITDTFSIPLGKAAADVYTRQPKLARIRASYMTFTNEEKELLFSKKNDETALVRIDMRAGIGGLLTCTACSFSQVVEGQRVDTIYDAFPPAGVSVVAPEHDDPLWKDRYPWTGGTEHLELMLILTKGASVRIHRTGHLRGMRKNTFLKWTRTREGFELLVTPEKKESQRPPVEAGGAQLSV